jgi:hypothetical protein
MGIEKGNRRTRKTDRKIGVADLCQCSQGATQRSGFIHGFHKTNTAITGKR